MVLSLSKRKNRLIIDRILMIQIKIFFDNIYPQQTDVALLFFHCFESKWHGYTVLSLMDMKEKKMVLLFSGCTVNIYISISLLSHVNVALYNNSLGSISCPWDFTCINAF